MTVGGPTLRLADTDPAKCHRCGLGVGTNATPHRGHDGRVFYLCSVCTAAVASGSTPRPSPHDEAVRFGLALNAALLIRGAVTFGAGPAEIATQIRGLLERYRAQADKVPLLRYTNDPVALFDLVVPNAPDAHYRSACIAELGKAP